MMIRMNRRISFFNKEVSSSFQFRNILNFWSRRVSSICETAVDNRRNTSFLKSLSFLSLATIPNCIRLGSVHFTFSNLHRGEKDEDQFLPL